MYSLQLTSSVSINLIGVIKQISVQKTGELVACLGQRGEIRIFDTRRISTTGNTAAKTDLFNAII